MARRDVARQLWMAETAIASIRRRRHREATRLRSKKAYDTTDKTDEEVLEELIGPDWREVVLEKETDRDAPVESDEGGEEPAKTPEPAAKTPIATDGDGIWQPGTVKGEKTPIATPSSWAGADGSWQYER